MATDNYCDCGGWVVGAGHEIPAPPADFSWGVQGPVIGCNNLRCAACSQSVRSAAGFAWSKETLQRRAEIYEHIADTGSAPWAALVTANAVSASDDERMYVCGCNVHVETEDRGLTAEADWDDDAPNWQCAGHPRLSLPVTLDGVAIGADAAGATTIVSAHLDGSGVNDAPGFVRDYPSAWVHRLVHLFAHESLAAALGNAVAAQLTSTEPAQRAAALDLFRRDPDAPGAEAVVAALRDESALFVGVSNPQAAGKELDEWLQVAVAHRAAAGDAEALSAIQHAALQSAPVQALLRAIATRAPSWLRDHATDVLRAHPTRAVARRLLYVMAPGLGDEFVAPAIDMGAADLIARETYLDLVRQLVKDERGAQIADALR